MDEFFKAGPLKQRDLYKAALARIAELEGREESCKNEAEDLGDLTVAELRSRCQDADIVGYGKMNKAALVEALS